VKKYLWFLIFSILFLAQAGICAEETETRAYSHRGRRDPFVPLVGVTARATESLEDVMSIDDVNLQGLASDSAGRKAAIINGEMIKEGETVGRLTVKKIFKNGIIVVIDDEEHKINIHEEGTVKGGQHG